MMVMRVWRWALAIGERKVLDVGEVARAARGMGVWVDTKTWQELVEARDVVDLELVVSVKDWRRFIVDVTTRCK